MVQWMGIINLTPDSFHEPSRVDAGAFVSRVRSFIDAGASFIDIGAVSTRPGAKDITVAEEWARLEPALRDIAGSTIKTDRIRMKNFLYFIFMPPFPFFVPVYSNLPLLSLKK